MTEPSTRLDALRALLKKAKEPPEPTWLDKIAAWWGQRRTA